MGIYEDVLKAVQDNTMTEEQRNRLKDILNSGNNKTDNDIMNDKLNAINKPLEHTEQKQKYNPINNIPVESRQNNYLSNKTEEQRHNIAIQGGKASQEQRRRKRTMQEVASAMLERKMSDEYIANVLGGDCDGLKDENGNIDRTLNAIMTARMVQEANNGNVKAYEVVRDTSGNKPRTDVQIEQITDKDRALLDKVTKALLKDYKP